MPIKISWERPGRRRAWVFLFSSCVVLVSSLNSISVVAAATLTFERAVSKALAFDPRLKAQKMETEALRAETYQASLSPNPEFSVDVDNFLGSGALSGFGGSEITLGLDQRFELGGKRAARINRGQAAEDFGSAELRAIKRAIIARVARDFFAVLGAQKKLALRKAQRGKFLELLRPLRERVAAGGSPEADLTRGQIAAEQAKIALESAQFELKAARQKLASNWSGHLSNGTRVRGDLLPPTREATPLIAILARLKSHPDLQKFEALHAVRLAELDVQHSLAVPDVTLGIGVRRFNETDDVALVAKGAVAIPIRDRNEGAILAAAERVGKAAYERDVVWQELKRRLIAAFGALHRNCHETRRYQLSIVPKARNAVVSIRRGYFRGRFKVVDLLDSITVLTEAQSRQIDTLVQCRTAAANIKTLTGIDPLNGQKLPRFAR